ncbi:uncharacterized protein LY89DRAFT_502146 [Mollisia scopiformis]|uniref:Uncharacterized protein n=1 Tax=Mollisia scopiformis TaxID=149040 RepID=A0A194XEV6_MOLSC|nr:uncharacterized protein LY89DRAFT_502146 [Mollisia scopiformis]KUJ18681.1 hypothetical protein LY89DRAFT_502146 [Mollisia scopiformis]
MCGKGVDQTTRSPQHYQVMAPELLEKHVMYYDENKRYDFELEESFFTEKMDFDIWGALARPVLPIKKVVPKNDADDYPWRISLGLFDLLSNELIDMVIDNISTSDDDLIALGLTCQGFWDSIVHRVQRRCIDNVAPWAGQKIALLGSWSTSLPPPLEANDLALKLVDDADYHVNRHTSRSLFCLFFDEGATLQTTKSRQEVWLKLVDKHLPDSGVPDWRWEDLREQFRELDLFPIDRDWILRNLTTHEYVSASFVSAGDRDSKIRLVDILLSQICWTNVPSLWGGHLEGLHEGAWAGHAFDIVTVDVLVKEGGKMAWKDVTDDVVEKVELLS